MTNQSPEKEDIVRYLLGTSTSERMENIEQRILLDDDFHQEVKIAEEELLDQYISGKLTATDRQLFETNFLSSSLRQQKLRFALALKRRCAAGEPSLSFFVGWPRSIYAYASVVLMVIVAVFISINYRLTKQLQQENVHISALTKELETAHQHDSGTAAAGWGPQDALVLTSLLPAGTRGEGLQEISVPSGVRAVQFSLPAPADFRSETLVDLLNDNNQVIMTLSGVHPQRIDDKQVFIVTFPRDYLRSGNYFLKIRGSSSGQIQHQYSFKVRDR